MEQLGIDFKLLLAQIVNFSIITIVLTKFLYKPIVNFVKKRQQKIDEGLALAEKMKEEKEKLEIDRKEILKKARKEAANVVSEAKKQSQKDHDELIAKAKLEIAKMRSDYEKQTESERKNLEKEMISHTVNIAEGITTRLIGDVLTEKDQKKLIQRQLARLEREYKK